MRTKGSGSHPDLITWQWSCFPEIGSESEAQDLRTKGKEKAFGEELERSIWR